MRTPNVLSNRRMTSTGIGAPPGHTEPQVLGDGRRVESAGPSRTAAAPSTSSARRSRTRRARVASSRARLPDRIAGGGRSAKPAEQAGVHLAGLRGRMKERQRDESDVLLRVRRAMAGRNMSRDAMAFEHHVLVRQLRALGMAGRAGRVEDDRGVVGAARGASRTCGGCPCITCAERRSPGRRGSAPRDRASQSPGVGQPASSHAARAIAAIGSSAVPSNAMSARASLSRR